MRCPQRAAVLGVVSLVLMTGCGNGTGEAAPGGSALAGRAFVSTGDVGVPGGGPLSFEFTDDGRLLASAGCNTLNAPVDLAGGRLTSTELAMTAMGCEPEVMASDQWLIDLISAEPDWDLPDPDTLVLAAGELTVTLVDRDIVEPPAELIGQRWDIDTVTEAELASSLPAGVEAHLVIDDGAVMGYTGCHEFVGTAEVTGQTIAFSGIGEAPGPCDPEADRADVAVRAVLDGETTYSISGRRLTLTAPNGQGLQATAD